MQKRTPLIIERQRRYYTKYKIPATGTIDNVKLIKNSSVAGMNKDMNTFAELIKQARKEEGITQTELANRLGYNSRYISNIESGKQEISIAKVEEIISAMGFVFKAEFSFTRAK